MVNEYPDRIWLIPNSGDELETTWCDSPAPGLGSDEEDAIPYVSLKKIDSGIDEIKVCFLEAIKKLEDVSKLLDYYEEKYKARW